MQYRITEPRPKMIVSAGRLQGRRPEFQKLIQVSTSGKIKFYGSGTMHDKEWCHDQDCIGEKTTESKAITPKIISEFETR
jgi:hypothetical protein